VASIAGAVSQEDYLSVAEGTTMLRTIMISRQILSGLRNTADRELDDLVLSLPMLSWNQVFLEVDRLSRTGEVQLSSKGGVYWLRLGPRSKEG
jgi:hypothetical protein